MNILAVFISMCLAATQLNYLTELKPKEQQNAVEAVSKIVEDESDSEKVKFNYDNLALSYPQVPTKTNAIVGYNDSKSWWFRRTDSGNPPTAQQDISILDYEGYYLGDTSRKVIYLTFDEGYEMGFTEKILDTLKENDVEAAFFVTKAFLMDEPELAKRMVDEGHVVGNHSVNHPKMSTLSDEGITNEINGCADYFKELTGRDMDPFFRPPAGEYSVRTLKKTKELGYKTIFWSFAYKDWIVDEQPGKEASYNMVMKYSHNGCIMLLHAVSESNTEALDSIIKGLRKEGYVFESLYDLPEADKLLEELQLNE